MAFATEQLASSKSVVTRQNRLNADAVGAEMAFVSNDVPTAFANAVAAGAVTCKHPQKNLGGKWSLSGGNNDFFNTIDPKQTQRMSAFESKSHDRVMYI